MAGVGNSEEKNNSAKGPQTVRNDEQNNSEVELFEPAEVAPMADIPALEKIGPGRQRRYEELGLNDVESVREVVLFRHEFGYHMPGLSDDTEAYYEHYYFSKPKRGEKYYDRHVKCWERRVKWIGSGAVKPKTSSQKIIPIKRRATG